MKKPFFILKVLTSAFMLLTCCQACAQDYSHLQQRYLKPGDIAFRVKMISHNEYKVKTSIDQKFYSVSMPGQEGHHQWVYYKIHMLDTALHLMSVYDPETAKIFIALHSDTFRVHHQLNKWDSLMPCGNNPVSFSHFSLSFPFVDCFYPEKYREVKPFKDMGTHWFVEDRHPYTGIKRKIWISKLTGLVDSIHNMDHKKITDRILFTYYYSISEGKKTDFNPVPVYYPLTIQNTHNMQIIQTQISKKTLSTYDSADIRKFIRNNKKLLLLDFWFIGCRPCHQVFPILNTIRETYDTSFVDIVALNPFDERSEIHVFKTRNKHLFNMQYDILHLNLYFQVAAYPSTLLINQDGEVLYRHSGPNENMEAELREILDRLKP